jgi:endonuclease-3
MTSVPKTKKFELLQKLLHRRYKWQAELPERTVLEHLVYSALLENAPAETATTAYEILESYFIDWNEVRVTTTPELAEIITILPEPNAAADRVRKALRGVFEKTYMFDLEELRKKGKSLSQAIAFLKSLGTLSRFMADYVTQFALGGHVIPLDESAMRVFRMLDLARVNKERTEESVPGIERAIPKKNGTAFTMELHNFAFMLRSALDADQNANEYLSVLKSIDPQSLTRNYSPPALTIPKPQQKEKIIIPSPVNIPFGAVADEEDFDDEHSGTEVEFLPKGPNITPDKSILSDRIVNNKTKQKNKKESTNEKITPITPTNPTIIETKAAAQKTQTTTTHENVTNKKTEPVLLEPSNKAVVSKVAVPTKTTLTPPITKTTPDTQKQKQPDKKNTTKNNIKQNQKTTLAKSQKKELPNNKPNIAQDKKNKPKQPAPKNTSKPKTNKIANDKKQPPTKSAGKSNNKIANKQKIKDNKNNNKNNNKKIVNIVSNESKSVTKQLQKKRPK